ncbi:MAG: PEP-CTERM sorting domain-containing protein, partial [Gammaproteobacteria bacterium]|nr:PEP-CTERM sorting domain-containing protein [Gammaproteobacteria bacterium]
AIAEFMHGFITPQQLRPDAMNNQQLQAAVTDLGLTYGLATRWTAFVAVSRQRYNAAPDGNVEADVALPMVAGVSRLAYNKPAMTGYAAPEPGMWLGLMVALLTWNWFRRKNHDRQLGGRFVTDHIKS